MKLNPKYSRAICKYKIRNRKVILRLSFLLYDVHVTDRSISLRMPFSVSYDCDNVDAVLVKNSRERFLETNVISTCIIYNSVPHGDIYILYV